MCEYQGGAESMLSCEKYLIYVNYLIIIVSLQSRRLSAESDLILISSIESPCLVDFGREEHEEKTIFLPPPLPYLSRFWPTHLVAIIPFSNRSLL